MISVEKGYLNDAKATQNALIRNSFAQQKCVLLILQSVADWLGLSFLSSCCGNWSEQLPFRYYRLS